MNHEHLRYFGETFGTFWGDIWDILGGHSGHSGESFGTLWGDIWDTLGSHLGYILATFETRFLGFPSIFVVKFVVEGQF